MPRTFLTDNRFPIDDQVLYRATAAEYTHLEHLDRLAIDAGLSSEEALRFVKRTFVVDIDYLVAYFFRKELAGKYPEGRFNSAQLSCIYASFEEATAGVEKAYQLISDANTIWPRNIAVYSLRFTGWSWDLTGIVDVRVLGDDWRYTQLVGQEASKDAEALFSKSARGVGHNAAVFAQYSVAAGVLVENFVVDGAAPLATAASAYNRRRVRARYS